MGTNYYLHRESCAHCGRGDGPLHIGKSGAGWAFSLHVYPEDGIKDLGDWQALWGPPHRIVNEYRDEVTPADMLASIAERPPTCLRHTVDGFCIGHGAGTWDLMVGEFS